MTQSEVYITRTSSFFPNEPISNDEMESYLGTINEQASKSRRIVLRNNGIENRYYAHLKDGTPTHTNAEMTALAIRKLFTERKEELSEIDLLSCGTSSPDQMMPSHAVMVHGSLPETNNIEVVSPSGVCCSGMHAFKYAYMSLALRQATKAVTSGSERFSPMLRSMQFEHEIQKIVELEGNPYIAFEKDFLRWMLSDGAGAFLLETTKNTTGISMRVDWIQGYSYANEKEVCMYMAGEKQDNGTLKSFMDYTPTELQDQSIMTIKQDVKLLSANIVPLGFQKFAGLLEEKNIKDHEIDYFLPHLSSYFFESKIAEHLENNGVNIPKEKWFTNLKTKGNVGAGSIYMMVDELFNSGRLKVGDKILLAVPESARFSYVFSLLTVC